MPVLRHSLNVYDKVNKVRGKHERSQTDPDFHWGSPDDKSEWKVFVLDEHEWFDPQTSSKGRHQMYGPAVIVQTLNMGVQTTEYHVNDPFVWNWIGRCIREGYLNGSTLLSNSHERDVKYGDKAKTA